MNYLFIDTETYNEVVDLKAAGTYRYAATCELLLVSWVTRDENGTSASQVWDATAGPMPEALSKYLYDSSYTKVAHNAMFDRLVLAKTCNAPADPAGWLCSMAKAYTLSLPGQLGQLGEALGIADDKAKMKDGRRLVLKFCKPAPDNRKVQRYTRETDPADWARFVEYARQDATALVELWDMMPGWNYKDFEVELWRTDQRINDRGFMVDTDLAAGAIRAAERAKKSANKRVTDATEGEVVTIGQRDKILAYFDEQFGFKVDTLRQSEVDAMLSSDLPEPVREILLARTAGNKSSTAKYKKVLGCTSKDRRLRGTMQYGGAQRTLRWAGRMFQPHNLPRPKTKKYALILDAIEAIKADVEDIVYGDYALQMCADAIRGLIVAPPGKKLVVSDLANIEGRKLSWLAGESWKLAAFKKYDLKEGPDLYCLAYARSFSIHHSQVGEDQRQIGKCQELALGYQGALGAFNTMAAAYGVNLPDEKVLELVRYWRDANPAIVSFWYELESAAIDCIRNPGLVRQVRRVAMHCQGRDWFRIRLPSGRFLCYYQPRLEPDPKGRPKVTYMGINQYSRKWTRLKTYGGKFAENITQAASRDVMANAMPALEDAGYEILLTVHDEIVTETPDSPEYNAAELSQILSRIPTWADETLPLAAKGFEAKRYRKD